MSMGMTAALQTALYQHLAADAALDALVSGRIYDAAPAGAVPGLYVVLGPEDVRDRSDASGGGATHDVAVSVISDEAGFLNAKAAAAAVSDALVDAAPAMARGRVVSLHFLRARARTVSRGRRRAIEMRFRVRVEDD